MEVLGLLMLAIILGGYFTPTFVALMRNHRQTLAIGLLNLFLGWTVVGWVVAVVWAASNPPAPVVVYREGPPPTR